MLAKQFTFAPGPLQQSHSPSSYMSMRELIQVEEVLRSCCELWLDKQWNSTVIKLGTCTVNVLSVINHVSHDLRIFESNLSVKLKKRPFTDMFIW